MSAKPRAALALLVVGAAVLAAPAAAGAAGHTPSDVNRDLASLRASTAAYHNRATAMADGYLPAAAGTVLDACIAIPDGPGMGVHWVDWELFDTTADAAVPEGLVYEPMPDGRMRLIAVEYFVPVASWDALHDDPPSLFGQEMHVVALPGIEPFYALHAWVWKHNPAGMHADFNPRVSCEHWD